MLPVLVELLRRAAAVVGLLSGLWLTLQTGEPLVLVRIVDFEHEYQRALHPGTRAGSLDDFIRRRTSGRVLDSSGNGAWADIARAAHRGSLASVMQRIDGHGGDTAWVIPSSALPEPTDMLAAGVAYVHVPAEHLWISVGREPANEIAGLDPRLVHPHRTAGLGLIGFALAVYAALPRLRVQPDGLKYSQTRAVVLPDLLGLAGAAFFFALPLLILAENAPGQPPWSAEGGWGWLTGAMWALAAVFLILPFIGLRYALLRLVITEEALVIATAFGTHTYAWTSMVGCAPYRSSRGAVLGLLLVLFARGPGMVGQGLLVATNTERGAEVRMRNGRPLRIMANALPGYAEVITALQQHGVDGAAQLAA